MESAQAARGAADAAAAGPEQADRWNDPRLPWLGKPRAADIFCWLGIVLSGVALTVLFALRSRWLRAAPVAQAAPAAPAGQNGA